MRLFINTGGKGERLYPLTKDIPKPLVALAGKPLLHHLVEWAKSHGIKDIVMMNGHKAEKIIDYFKDGSHLGVHIMHSTEPYPLGSGGPLKFAQQYIDGRFINMSGDVFCKVDLKKMLAFHEQKKADITIHVHKSSHPHDSDILNLNPEGKVLRFISKHDDHAGAGDLSNSGLSILEPHLIQLMDRDAFTFETYLYPKFLEHQLKFYGYHTEEFMLDIGTPERLQRCEALLAAELQKH